MTGNDRNNNSLKMLRFGIFTDRETSACGKRDKLKQFTT
jgi:hypothetical protein